MVERICQHCQHGNPLENRFCGSCGASLEQAARLLPNQETSLAVASSKNMPVQLKQVGKAVAVSLLALAAEAGMTWLRRRIDQMQVPPVQQTPPPAQTSLVPRMTRPTLPTRAGSPTSAANTVTILRHRVVQTWERGVLTRQTVERTIWRREE
jgi:hypothetical protein